VTTIVAKLFNIVKPHVAVFGQKDAQQAVVIRRMAKELNYDVEIIVAPTRRDPDGLAMSSRNSYLSPAEREDALALHRGLQLAAAAYRAGERRSPILEGLAENEIRKSPSLKLDYAEIVDAGALSKKEILSEGDIVFLLVAVRIGTTRLIDNIVLGEEA
jgi:pantoate--beta-alanine ligase